MTNPRGFFCIFIPASTAPMLSISQLGIADLWYNRSHLRQNVCHISCSVEKLPLRFVGELYPKSLSGNPDHGVLLGLVCVLKNWYEVSLLWGGSGCFHRPQGTFLSADYPDIHVRVAGYQHTSLYTLSFPTAAICFQ